MKVWIAEAIGTFCLVFAGTGAIAINDLSGGKVTHVGIALTFGLVVMAMIYAVGDVSGAHINPAVTLGFWLSRRLPGRSAVPYLASQLVGAVAASVLMRALFDHATLGATRPAGTPSQSFVLEVVLAAILMFVILSVASGTKEKGDLSRCGHWRRDCIRGLVRRADLRGVDEPRPVDRAGRCERRHG